MSDYNQAYEDGKEAYKNGVLGEDNPHYKAFGDLSQEFHDWLDGWRTAEDAWYYAVDASESQDWQDYLNLEENND